MPFQNVYICRQRAYRKFRDKMIYIKICDCDLEKELIPLVSDFFTVIHFLTNILSCEFILGF